MKRFLSLLIVVFSTSTMAAVDVEKLVEKSNLAAYYAGKDGKSAARMTIVDSNGRKQRRQFVILRRDVEDGGEQKFLVVFSRPADIKGTTFLVHKKIVTDDDRWLYLPALDLVKRISAGDKRTSFVGSHYFYEDVSGRGINEDTHEFVSEDGQYFVLKHTPKKPEEVEFTFYKTWINKETYLPTRIEYTDAQGKVYRLIEALEIKNIQGYPTVVKAKVSNPLDGSYTLLEFRGIKYDLGLPDDIFAEPSLRNPPVKWLRK